MFQNENTVSISTRQRVVARKACILRFSYAWRRYIINMCICYHIGLGPTSIGMR